jgi:hypothetical protein
MRDEIHRLNIQHYKKVLLQSADDPWESHRILKLLAEEEAKLDGALAGRRGRSLSHAAADRIFLLG